MSRVRPFGRVSRPGLPCLRAAVLAYLFQIAIVNCLSDFLEHAEMLTQIDAVFVQLRGRGDDRDVPGIEDDEVVGGIEDEPWILLDQHDRQPAFLQFTDCLLYTSPSPRDR